MIEGCEAFILANTRLQTPPHTPELVLHLADEITPIWRKTEEELGQMGLPPPFWAFAWAGGQALARHILDNPDIVAGKRVVDFASGSGIVAIAAMKAGAALSLNAAANGVSCDFTSTNLLDAPCPAADVVLAGDICYEKPLAERVVAWLKAARDTGSTVLVGDPGRTYFPKDGMTKLAEYQVATTRELEDMEVKKTGVWSFIA